jgi:hypothetical protein
MRLSKKVWLIVAIVIFAIVLGILFSIYSGQAGERNELKDRLNNAQILLPGLIDNKEELEDQLTQAESLLDRSQAEFPESVDSIEYDDDLFKIADDSNVNMTRVTSTKPANTKVGAVTYSISAYVVVVKGNVEDILDFIYTIRTGDDFQLPWSANVKDIKMAIDGGGSTATISLDIYGYRGA